MVIPGRNYRFFLSELMLYTGYTDEEQLGCDDEKRCCELYLKKKDAIQHVKMHIMPFTDGVDEARHFVEEAMKDDRAKPNDIGDVLDPEQEKEIEDCQNCEYKFRDPHGLTTHLRCHGQAWVQSFTNCNKSVQDKSCLIDEVGIVHAQLWPSPSIGRR